MMACIALPSSSMRGDDFVMYKNGQPYHTTMGNEVTHSNARLLRLSINQAIHSPLRENLPLHLLEKNADYRFIPVGFCVGVNL